MEPITVDFETEAIDDRPHYPPVPVGVAIQYPDGYQKYLAWGHPTENNCTFEEAQAELASFWGKVPMIFHNGKFDCEVAEAHMGLPLPHWEHIHDTMFLLYLYNPHARTLSLKPSAEQLLDWPPDEQDRLRAWILGNVPGATAKTWGAFISKAPAGLTGEYAIGDVGRTAALFNFLMPYITDNGMLEAYRREQELMPILLETEQRGMRVDRALLEKDTEFYEDVWLQVEAEIHGMLGEPHININSGPQLATRLVERGMVHTLPLTPTGRVSTARASLEAAITEHPRLLALLAYRGGLKTALSTFLRPWCRMVEAGNGRLHTSWHQTRGAEEYGTRTGRISSSRPNLTNVPNEFKAEAPEGYPPLPLLRRYLLPEEGCKWVKRDYASQEIRVAAHFEDGDLMRAYQKDPMLDPHAMAAEIIRQSQGFVLPRKTVKIYAFSLIYGTGVKGLSERQNISRQEAAQTKDMYLSAVPGIRDLMRDIKARGAAGLPVRTTGGRLLFSEPATNGRRFDYKLLNHLVQGSSADMTKQALINYHKTKIHGEILAQVYDEVNISVPEEHWETETEILRLAMEAVPLDVLPVSEGYVGNNWLEADK